MIQIKTNRMTDEIPTSSKNVGVVVEVPWMSDINTILKSPAHTPFSYALW